MLQQLFKGRMSRQNWWTGTAALVAIFLVWSMGSDFLLPGPAASLVSLLFLLPFSVLCARRLTDLDRPLWPTLALLMAPFVLHTVLTDLTNLGGRQTSFETGISESSAVVLAPNLIGWVVIAWLAAALAWIVVVLGTRESLPLAEAAQS